MPTKRSISNMRYDRKSTKHYGFKFNLATDADIIKRLDEQPVMQSYIKSLIRADIAAHPSQDTVPDTQPVNKS